MRMLSGFLVLAALASASVPAAAQGLWCSEDMNSRNCGFYTLEQCRAAASGNNGRCDYNFMAPQAATEQAKQKKRAKSSHQ
jgi:uncharacterized protein DUF3551